MPKSVLNKVLVSMLLIIPGSVVIPFDSQPAGCDGIKVEIQISKSASLKGNIEVVVTGAESPVYYIYYTMSGNLLIKDVNSSKVENIAPGTYFCSIVDAKGCTKKTEFKIE